MSNKIILKPNRDKPVRQKHPWIFSGAIERIDSASSDGDLVDVLTSQGEFLARGYLNRRSQIAVRLLTWLESEAVDEGFWARRLALAELSGRRNAAGAAADGDGEGDGDGGGGATTGAPHWLQKTEFGRYGLVLKGWRL